MINISITFVRWIMSFISLDDCALMPVDAVESDENPFEFDANAGMAGPPT